MLQADSDPAELAAGLAAGDRRALARAITLVESELESDREKAAALLDALLPRAGSALRVAVSGAPGVGKSTLIDALGRHVIASGGSVAVLAIDPSSHVSGGSVLGDKTRMARLSASERSFVRPSPSAGIFGGIAPRTREALIVCEAAGFDTVVVETVGVGQSEHRAAGLVDAFVLLAAPGAGDELQGMKRGILEVADVIAVNKADGPDRERAEQAAAELRSALGLVARRARAAAPTVLTLSALEERGVAELWSGVTASVAEARASGAFEARRRQDRLAWLEEEIERTLRARFLERPAVAQKLAELEQRVALGSVSPPRAARELAPLLER